MKTQLPYWKTYTWLVLFLALFTNIASAQNCSVNITTAYPVICPQSYDSLWVTCTGKSPYNFKWSASSGSQAPANYTTQQTEYSAYVNPTVTTTYTVTLTDQVGCTSIAYAVVKVATPFTSAMSSTPAGCNGGNNGTATVTSTGGAEPYSYFWETSPPQTTKTATGLASGKYRVDVRDARNCFSNFDSVEVAGSAAFTADVTFSKITCKGQTSTATATVNGTSGPFTYIWDGNSSQNGATVQGLAAGGHYVKITDKNSCYIFKQFSISGDDVLRDSLQVYGISCAGQCNAYIAANTLGGKEPYSYSWSNGSTSKAIGNLCPGSYSVTITDAGGCTVTNSATIIQPAELIVTGSSTPSSCSTSGSAKANASGGTPSYTYLWSPVPPNNQQGKAEITGLAPGTYNCTVTDAKGCSRTVSVQVADNGAGFTLTVYTTSDSGNCKGNAGASASPNVPYTYSWSNGQTTKYISGLCSGQYCVTVTNSNGCSRSACETVKHDSTITAPLQVTFTYVKPSCGTICNGSITAKPYGGTAPYTYLWSKPTGYNKAENINLCAGEYNVTVTDSKGKTVSATARLEQGASIVVTINKGDASCKMSNGYACAQASGGTSPYTFTWNNGKTTSCLQGIPAGQYIVTVTDANGCSKVADVTINDSPGFTLSMTRNNASGPGKCDGSAKANLSPSGTYTYTWGNGKTTAEITALCKGTYCVTVSNSTGCSQSACVSVTDSTGTPPELKLYTGKQNPSCNGNCDGMAYASAQGGTSPYTYKWSKPTGFSDPINKNLCAGEYSVTVTDSKGVTRSAIVRLEKRSMEIKVTKQNASCPGKKNGYACVYPSNSNGKYTYTWSNGGTTPCIQALGKGTYSVTVADTSGCSATASILIEENSNTCDSTYQVKGIVYLDVNGNCIKDQNEKGIKDITIKAEPGIYYAKTDGDGRYTLVLPKGTFTISQVINNTNLKQLCPKAPSNYSVTTGSAPIIYGKDFGDQYVNPTSTDCPRLYVNLNLAKTRPCSKGTFNVYYGNNGGKDVQNGVVKVTVDPQITLLTSNIAWSSQNGNVYTFNVGTIPAGKYKNIEGSYKLACDARNSDTKCAVAHIYPDSTCEKPDSRWDGSHLVLKGSCTGDSVRFVIVNTGKDMAGTSNYRIYKDSSLYAKKDYMLKSGDSLVVNTPATGATYRMETDQRPYHPGKSHPCIAIEKCGKNGSSGYITAYRQDNEDDHEAISCFQVTTSFDPNEKSVVPSGITSQYHYVDSTAALTYTINFQNTGNDTAFTVVIRDTLSKFLNMATIKTTETSHPTSFRIIGNNILEWTFNNINLPDSFTNETLSHGFVAFRIEQIKNNAIGSRIDNKAAIYFDYNPAVLTNTTFVTVGDIQSLTAVPMVYITTAHVSVAPNPFRDETTFTLSGLSNNSSITLQVYDIAGRLVKSIENISDTQFILNSSGMDSGLYLYKLMNNQGLVATGKLTVSQ